MSAQHNSIFFRGVCVCVMFQILDQNKTNLKCLTNLYNQNMLNFWINFKTMPIIFWLIVRLNLKYKKYKKKVNIIDED